MLHGKPRFLVIDALAEGITLDPIQGMNMTGDPVDHIHDVRNSELISIAQKHDGSGGQVHYFTAIIDWPPTGTPELSSSTRELVTANDFIYWGGGLCDHGMYNGSVHNRNVTIIPRFSGETDSLNTGGVPSYWTVSKGETNVQCTANLLVVWSINFS